MFVNRLSFTFFLCLPHYNQNNVLFQTLTAQNKKLSSKMLYIYLCLFQFLLGWFQNENDFLTITKQLNGSLRFFLLSNFYFYANQEKEKANNLRSKEEEFFDNWIKGMKLVQRQRQQLLSVKRRTQKREGVVGGENNGGSGKDFDCWMVMMMMMKKTVRKLVIDRPPRFTAKRFGVMWCDGAYNNNKFKYPDLDERFTAHKIYFK